MLEAVIWDMDGVLVDTGPLHFEAWRHLAAELGKTFTAEDFRRTFGMRSAEIIATTFGEGIPDQEVAALADRKEALFRNGLQGRVKALPGALDLLGQLHRARYKQALASSAPYANVEMILDALRAREYFDAIVSEKDVQVGKPDPQVFLVAAQRLGASPECCLVIEDAVPGVQAAKAARMKCIAVNDKPNRGLEAADLVVNSLAHVDLAALRSLFPPPRDLSGNRHP